MDIDGEKIAVTGLPAVPEGTQLARVDVIVRLQGTPSRKG